MNLRRGSRGEAVRALQLKLRSLGHYEGDIDGMFGPLTQDAVVAFQKAHDELYDDGVVGPMTAGRLDQALGMHDPGPVLDEDVRSLAHRQACSDETWDAFQELRRVIDEGGVRYGPGRGLFHDGRWVITKGPGRLGHTDWRSTRRDPYPSFHCSSFTNFFLGWLLCYNEDYTHSGNVPPLDVICTKDRSLHDHPVVRDYRGYSESCLQVVSSGSTADRHRVAKRRPRIFDAKEIYERRAELPTFIVCGQSTYRGRGRKRLKWWHHTLLFVIDHRRPERPMYRLSADGARRRTTGVYFAKPFSDAEIDEEWCNADVKKHIYRGFGVVPDDAEGNFGGDRERRPVVVEE